MVRVIAKRFSKPTLTLLSVVCGCAASIQLAVAGPSIDCGSSSPLVAENADQFVAEKNIVGVVEKSMVVDATGFHDDRLTEDLPTVTELLCGMSGGEFERREEFSSATNDWSIDVFRIPQTRKDLQTTLNVSDFISPEWQQSDDADREFLKGLTTGEPMEFSDFALATNPDASLLSVPEVPIPAVLIPGIIGVGVAMLAHRRSLKSRKNL